MAIKRVNFIFGFAIPPGMSITLLTLNIERDRHLKRVTELLGDEKPHVACLQEVTRKGFEKIRSRLSLEGDHRSIHVREGTATANHGIAILTRLGRPIIDSSRYLSLGEQLPGGGQSRQDCELLSGVVYNGQEYQITTTYGYWTHDGRVNKGQQAAFANLLEIIPSLGGVVLCGDFNAPRGGDIHRILTDRLADHLPPNVTSTIDPQLHRKPDLKVVVDYIFSTPHYEVSNVRLVDGVSDHVALIGTVRRI